jgi:LPXTG-motif cell wall-anchored protein
VRAFLPIIDRKAHEERTMQSIVGIALLVVGVVLIVFGMQASASLGSRLSELFTGAPSDRTIWLLLAGVAAALLGIGLLLTGRRRMP